MGWSDPAFVAALVAGLCLLLWLTEVVPPFVPTLVLLAAMPLCGVGLGEGLGWMADPVLLLFFGGLALGEACSFHGIDRVIIGLAARLAGGRALALLAVVIAATAFLSMWMSNVAATALMLAALRPVLTQADDGVRRGLLVGVAVGANLGGMATPIGSGPNAIAVASLDPEPSFGAWMAMALPLTLGSLVAGGAIIAIRHGIGPKARTEPPEPTPALPHQRPLAVAIIGALAIGLWLSEPVTGIPAAVVSLGTAAAMFGSRLLPKDRLAHLDWSTLLVVGGGVGLGHLLEDVGWLEWLSGILLGWEAPRAWLLAALLFLTAGLSALMSNTATATLLIPMAMAIEPEQPAVALLVALAASFGMPFVVSTPANAMVVGRGANSRDLLVPGLILMIGGCGLLAATGLRVLGLYGY